MTEADLAGCTMHEAAHFNGGKEWFGFMLRCDQHPRLTRMDKYFRGTRKVESTWRVDGILVRDLAAATECLSKHYRPSAEEIELLKLVPDEWTRLEQRSRFLPLREVGLVEFKDGDCRRTETGRDALRSQSSSTGSR